MKCICIYINFIAGSDYNSTVGVYSLTGRETVTVDIEIIEDGKLEQTEVFYASLSFVIVPPRVALQPDRTEINLIDASSELIQSPHTQYSSHIHYNIIIHNLQVLKLLVCHSPGILLYQWDVVFLFNVRGVYLGLIELCINSLIYFGTSLSSAYLFEVLMCLHTALIFSFRVSAYSFMENIGTGTVYVDKISGSTDLDITLRVSGCKLNRVENLMVQ